jgi:hypothetical protein
MTAPSFPLYPPPLATDAATARTLSGPCSLCQHVIARNDRYARLPTGRLAHVPCISLAAVRIRRPVPLIR